MRDPRIISYEASAAIDGYRIAAGAGVDAKVRRAAAATDKLVGIVERMGASAGTMCDVIVAGPAEVTAGAAFDAFDPITADAQGRAVKASPSAGQTVGIIGFAQASAVAGDIVIVNVAPSLLKG